MKKHYFLCLFSCIATLLHSQSTFEKGYIIQNNGQKIAGFIEYVDYSKGLDSFKWCNNSLGRNPTIYNLSNIKEVVFGDGEETVVTKYKKVSFVYDSSASENIKTQLLSDRQPNFVKNIAFLKVLLEGEKISLYSYTDVNNRNHYFTNKNKAIEELVYHPYLENDTVKFNQKYKTQLATLFLEKPNFVKNELNKVRYTKNSLIDIIADFHTATNSKVQVYRAKKIKVEPTILLNLSSIGGIYYPTNTYPLKKANLYGIGGGINVYLPNTKNRLSLPIEVIYEWYKTDNHQEKGDSLTYSFNRLRLFASLQYQFGKNTHLFRPFVGAGVTYCQFLSHNVQNDIYGETRNLSTAELYKNGLGEYLFLGTDIGKKFSFRAGSEASLILARRNNTRAFRASIIYRFN